MPNPLRSLGHTLAALTANCGDFHAVWERAGATPGHGERWSGEWRSQVNGHHGALLCLLRRTSDAAFQASFHARYARWLRVCYQTTLNATPLDDGWSLEGQADLGALAGGVYTYRGQLTPAQFLCSYQCRYDRGAFDLHPFN